MTSTLKRTALAVLGLIVLQLAVLGTAAALVLASGAFARYPQSLFEPSIGPILV